MLYTFKCSVHSIDKGNHSMRHQTKMIFYFIATFIVTISLVACINLLDSAKKNTVSASHKVLLLEIKAKAATGTLPESPVALGQKLDELETKLGKGTPGEYEPIVKYDNLGLTYIINSIQGNPIGSITYTGIGSGKINNHELETALGKATEVTQYGPNGESWWHVYKVADSYRLTFEMDQTNTYIQAVRLEMW